jgi:uncharacterized membrane protein
VVADLHGHLLNLPLVLLFIALILSFVFRRKIMPWFYPAAGFFLAVFYMTNAWDFATYLLLTGAVIFWFQYLKLGVSLKLVIKTGLITLIILVAALAFSLPFQLNFSSIAQGIGLVDFRSPAWMLLVLWGLPLIFTLQYLLWFKHQKINPLIKKPKLTVFILILLFLAWVLILIPEVIYLKDIYIHSHQRANTMFKLTYQAFVIFALATPFVFFNLLQAFKKNWQRLVYGLIMISLIFFVLRYPAFAIQSYYGLKNYQGLDGLKYLQQLYPDDYQAILWLRKNITGQPVIVEAVGESYTDFARVSANTGLPTILGWRVHEWLWRGSFDEAGKRTEEVRLIYESPDSIETKTLLNQYQVEMIFIGQLEKDQYPGLDEIKLEQLGETIFSSGETKIISIRH